MAQPSLVALAIAVRAVSTPVSKMIWGQDRYIVQYRLGVGTGATTASTTFTIEHAILTTDWELFLSQTSKNDIVLTYPTPGMAGMGAPNPITDAQIAGVSGFVALPAAMVSGATLPVTLNTTTRSGMFYVTGPLRRIRVNVSAYTPATNADDTGLFVDIIGKE